MSIKFGSDTILEVSMPYRRIHKKRRSWVGLGRSCPALCSLFLTVGIHDGASANEVQKAASAQLTDPKFQEPYIDVDQWRDKPVRHRYVHGGFKGTTARLRFLLPAERAIPGKILPARYARRRRAKIWIERGHRISGTIRMMVFRWPAAPIIVLTNEGGLTAIAGDQTIVGYRINAAAAEYSRIVAAQMYGPGRPYGYAFGGSGGCFKTLSGFENTKTWDGAVPFVCGSPMAIPNVLYGAHTGDANPQGQVSFDRRCRRAWRSGDMYQDLNEEQRAALREVTKMGFPPAAWFNYKTIGEGAFPVLFPLIRMLDRSYFKDFWTVPGYEGFNPARLSLKREFSTPPQ